jgi:phosphopantothenoylcysteine decarboxylase/phosphopantothenate--cysteine ligase
MNPFRDQNVILGITGSIAAYKAADLASKLAQSGAKVNAVLTEAATQFISPLTFQSVTGQRAYTESDLWGSEAHVLHVGLAHQADLMVIAPATATTIAKLANGIADNLLTVTALACGTGENAVPMLIAPAMDAGMYSHEATQDNINTLKQRGVIFIGPEEGHLASGLVAKGRLSEPLTIFGNIGYTLSRGGPLTGLKIVVTAGGTREEIDPVRFITNRSSGKQGYAIATAAINAGADVTLISGPTNLDPPEGSELVSIRSSSEISEATLQSCQHANVLIMAAAVSDFRPIKIETQKIKKSDHPTSLTLEPAIDVLSTVVELRKENNFPQFVIGFAAETADLITNAQEKLRNKRLDLIVANDITAVGSGFAVDTNKVTFIFANGEIEALPMMTKGEVADRIINEIIKALPEMNINQ